MTQRLPCRRWQTGGGWGRSAMPDALVVPKDDRPSLSHYIDARWSLAIRGCEVCLKMCNIIAPSVGWLLARHGRMTCVQYCSYMSCVQYVHAWLVYNKCTHGLCTIRAYMASVQYCARMACVQYCSFMACVQYVHAWLVYNTCIHGLCTILYTHGLCTILFIHGLCTIKCMASVQYVHAWLVYNTCTHGLCAIRARMAYVQYVHAWLVYNTVNDGVCTILFIHGLWTIRARMACVQ